MCASAASLPLPGMFTLKFLECHPGSVREGPHLSCHLFSLGLYLQGEEGCVGGADDAVAAVIFWGVGAHPRLAVCLSACLSLLLRAACKPLPSGPSNLDAHDPPSCSPSRPLAPGFGFQKLTFHTEGKLAVGCSLPVCQPSCSDVHLVSKKTR